MLSSPSRPLRLSCILATLALVCGSCGDRKSSREVVLYASIDETYTREVARLFEAQTGITVKLVSDTEATKSTGLVNRLIAEKNRPVADVFWSGDVMRAAMLKQRGIARPYQPAGIGDLPKFHSDPDQAFTGTAGRLRLIVYHKDRAGDTLPSSVLDLAEPEFAGRSCLANPMFGTSSMHAAVLFESLGDERARKFFRDFAANGGRMLSSNGEVKRRVASGEFAFGLTDSDDVSVALGDGKPVGFIVPDQQDGGSGAVLIPTAAVLIEGAPHPEEARKLVDFLASATVENYLAESIAGHFPLRPGQPGPKLLGIDLSRARTISLDFTSLAKTMETLQDGFLKDWTAAQAR